MRTTTTTMQTKTGWHPVRAIDLRAIGNEPGACERCGRRDLRFLHTLVSPNGMELQVGCECARRLCFGYAPEREEQRLRNLWVRRSRWLTRKWGVSWNGNQTLTFRAEGMQVRVTVFAGQVEVWAYCIAVAGQPSYSPGAYESQEAAKLAAFDELAAMCAW